MGRKTSFELGCECNLMEHILGWVRLEIVQRADQRMGNVIVELGHRIWIGQRRG